MMAGVGRSDGLAFNQRYFLEILPLLAIALLIVYDEMKPGILHLIIGLLGAGFVYAIVLMLPSRSLHEMALLRVPLVLAFILLLGWTLYGSTRMRFLMPVALGLCLGWSACVHMMDGLPASRSRRHRNAALLNGLEVAVPNHSAVFTYGGWRDAAGALVLTRDIVLLDAGADEGKDSGVLSKELAGQGRSIFVLGDVFPPGTVQRIVAEDSLVMKFSQPIPLYELVRKNRTAR